VVVVAHADTVEKAFMTPEKSKTLSTTFDKKAY
jgi:hypothetical protein